MTFFVYGVFIGAAARRNDHLCLSVITEAMTGRTRLIVETFNRLVILRPALCMVYFGYLNFLAGFGNFRMPSMTPLASLYAAIPLSGALIALFTVEQLVNGWLNGFAAAIPNPPSRDTAGSIYRHDSRLPRDFAGLLCSMPLHDRRRLGFRLDARLSAGADRRLRLDRGCRRQ
jgi:hypothetical protein